MDPSGDADGSKKTERQKGENVTVADAHVVGSVYAKYVNLSVLHALFLALPGPLSLAHVNLYAQTIKQTRLLVFFWAGTAALTRGKMLTTLPTLTNGLKNVPGWQAMPVS